MAFVQEIGAGQFQQEVVVRPENTAPPEEKKDLSTEVLPETKPEGEVKVEEPKEGEVKVEGAEEKKEDEVLKVDEGDFFEANGGKQHVEQGVKFFNEFLYNFDGTDFLTALKEQLPNHLNDLARAFRDDFGDWFTKEIFGVSKDEFDELIEMREEYSSMERPDEDARIKALLEDEDPEKREYGKMLKENKEHRERRAKEDNEKKSFAAQAFRRDQQNAVADLNQTAFKDSESALTAAGFKPIQIKMGDTISKDTLDSIIVRGGFAALFSEHPGTGEKMRACHKVIEEGNFNAVHPSKPYLKDQANKLATAVIGRYTHLLKCERELSELRAQPAIDKAKKEPAQAAAITSASTVVTGTPQSVNGNGARPKPGTRADESLLSAEVQQLIAEGKLQRR